LIGLVVAVIAVSVAAGVAIERRSRIDARRVSRLIVRFVLWFAVPFASFFIVARLELTVGVGVGLGLAYVVQATVGVAAYLIGSRLLRLPRPAVGALICCVMLSNTGFLGVPLVAALLGPGALGPAVAFDAAVSGPMFVVAGFLVGAAFSPRPAASGAARLRAFLRNPPLYAVIAGLLAPDALAPDVLLDVAHVLVYALLPVGFLLVGITLATEAEDGALGLPPRLDAPVATVMGLRLVLAPLLMLGLSAMIVDVPDAYLVQAAMPSAINSLVLAHAYLLDLRLAAAAVTWTTAAALPIAVVAGAL
jgi:predicted permease